MHLILWQITPRRVPELKQYCFFSNVMISMNSGNGNEFARNGSPSKKIETNHMATFETVTLQGTMDKEDLTELCALLLTKTSNISFLSC